jgi:hypothetical protein
MGLFRVRRCQPDATDALVLITTGQFGLHLIPRPHRVARRARHLQCQVLDHMRDNRTIRSAANAKTIASLDFPQFREKWAAEPPEFW